MRAIVAIVICLVLVGCGVPSDAPPQITSGSPVGMELLGGFGEHEAVVVLDGKEVYRGQVQFNPVLDKGTRSGGRVNGKTFELEVRVQNLNINHKQTLNLKAGSFLDIKVIDGKVQVIQLKSGNKVYE